MQFFFQAFACSGRYQPQADQAAQVHYDGFKSFTILVAPCKGVRILVQSEIQEILLAEWGIVGFKESRIPLRIALFHWQKNNESSPDIRNPRSGIQNLGFPYMGPASLQSRFFQRKRDWRDLEAAIMKLSNWKLTRLHNYIHVASYCVILKWQRKFSVQYNNQSRVKSKQLVSPPKSETVQ